VRGTSTEVAFSGACGSGTTKGDAVEKGRTEVELTSEVIDAATLEVVGELVIFKLLILIVNGGIRSFAGKLDD
jgi:hypothetical protein